MNTLRHLSVAKKRGVSSYEGLIATRTGLPTTSFGTNKYIQNRSGHIATANITAIRILVANAFTTDSGGPETTLGASGDYTASIEYPADTFTQITWSASATKTVADGATALSDYVTVSIPLGATFWVRQWIHNTGGIMFNAFRNAALGDKFNTAAILLTDITMGGVQIDVGDYCLMPLAIIGMTDKASIVIVGDSIGAGYLDTQSADLLQGLIAKAFDTSVPFANLSTNSIRASNFTSVAPIRASLFPYCSHAIIQVGRNDLSVGGDSPATIKTSLETLIAVFPARVKKTVCPLMMTSSSTDSWATTANQTTNSNESDRVSINTTIRASGVTGQNNGYFEVIFPVESANNSGKFKVDGTANKYTSDGIHLVPAGYTLGCTGVNSAQLTYP